MFVLGGPVDVYGNTFIACSGHNWHFSVAMTKDEGHAYKATGRIPIHIAAKFENYWREKHELTRTLSRANPNR